LNAHVYNQNLDSRLRGNDENRIFAKGSFGNMNFLPWFHRNFLLLKALFPFH